MAHRAHWTVPATSVRRRLVVSLLAASSIIVGLCPIGATAASPPGPTSPSSAVLGDLVSGTPSYDGGTYVWTDYANDDSGADTDGTPGGNGVYPAYPYPKNDADLIQLQLGETSGGAVKVRAVMNTLGAHDGSGPRHGALIGIGFDLDRRANTGAPSLPGGALGSGRDPLGLEYVLLLSTATRDGQLLRWQGRSFRRVASVKPSVSLASNSVSAVVPALRPGSRTWRVLAATGPALGHADWSTGKQPILDLAFVHDTPIDDPSFPANIPASTAWNQDYDQSAVLAGKLPAARAAASVTFGTRRTVTPHLGPGKHDLMYQSTYYLGRGDFDCPADPRCTSSSLVGDHNAEGFPTARLGRFQYYLVNLPQRRLPRPGLMLHLPPHESISEIGAFDERLPQGNALVQAQGVVGLPWWPGVLRGGNIAVVPNGRGDGWFATSYGQYDALDSIADATQRFHADPDHVVVSGIEAGAVGTLLLGALYPDKWAGVISLNGSGDEVPENFTNVPVRTYSGALDPIGNAVSSWTNLWRSYESAGTVPYQSVLDDSKTHIPSLLAHCWFTDLLSQPRDRDPGRVRYTIPAPGGVDARSLLDLQTFVALTGANRPHRPDAAYWTSGLQPRDASGAASIDATSSALPQHVTTPGPPAVHVGTGPLEDFCGAKPLVDGYRDGSLGTVGVWQSISKSFTNVPADSSNQLTLALSNLRAATIDLTGTGLSQQRMLTLQLNGDGRTNVTLTGIRASRLRLTCGGTSIWVAVRSGRAAIDRNLAGHQVCQVLAVQ